VKLAEHIHSEVVEDFPQSSKRIESSPAEGEVARLQEKLQEKRRSSSARGEQPLSARKP
jgi:hypothetical protein